MRIVESWRLFSWLGGPTCALLLLSVAGCSGPPPRSQPEDQTRRVAPLPACVLHLTPGTTGEGTLRRLQETEVVKLILPNFDESTRRLPSTGMACTGSDVWGDPVLAGGVPLHRESPWMTRDGDVLYGAAGNRVRVVWLRALAFSDGTVGGPIALVRGDETFAELFAVGVFRGLPDRVTLGSARLGSRLVVTAENDDCSGRPAGTPCEDSLAIFLPSLGELRRVVEAPIERIAYSVQGEKGASGGLEYRLTSTADYRVDGVHFLEQLAVRDETGVLLRQSERERAFLVSHGTSNATVPTLWDSVPSVEGRPVASARTAGGR